MNSCLKIDYWIQNRGYPLEIHSVTTEDGYILSLYRIKHGKNGPNHATSSKKHPVFIMHGMFLSCCEFMLDKTSLAYYLADSGFDVWLGNNRGTPFSKKHVRWDCDKDRNKYWDFSYHEIGYYDIAASIDYVVKNTGISSIYFIGHSQGTTAFFVLMSLRTEYNAKVRLGIMLAAAAVGQNTPIIPVYDMFAIPYLKLMVRAFGPFGFSMPNKVREFFRYTCSFFSWFELLCCFFMKKLFSIVLTPYVKDIRIYSRLLNFTPTTISAKQILHYGQAREVGLLRNYNYGDKKNLELYGCTEPPLYDLSKISSPIIIFVGKEDLFAHPADLDELIGRIGPNAKYYHIERSNYRHFDFLVAEDSLEMVNKPILNFLNDDIEDNF